MDQMGCEAVANVSHLVNCASIKLVGQQLLQKLVPIVADLVDTPLNVALKLLAKPPALGFGNEKLVLDNSFFFVYYENQRYTNTNQAEFKSVAHPVESSSLAPPARPMADNRVFAMSSSDYVADTLFESLYAEHIGEVKIPNIKTMRDKQGPKFPIVIAVKFAAPLQQTFEDGHAAIAKKKAMMEVGALKYPTVMPMD